MYTDKNNRIAYWMSEKKMQKINWVEFEEACRKHGFEIFKLDLSKSLESQGPFSVFLHKLTDIIALENQGDVKSSHIIQLVENYILKHPSLIVIDPIPNVRQLLVWYFYAKLLRNHLNDHEKTAKQLRDANVKYPFICKPKLGHGSKKAHEMCIIFDERHLRDCRAPCVAQTFINHNAILYKIFIVGQRHYFVERPSLKNFYANERQDTIYFDSSDISRATSQSSLSVLDPADKFTSRIIPNPNILSMIAMTLRKAFAMDLLGIDVVIDNSTGKYGIVDVNAYPGYDGFPNFYDALLQCIRNKFKNSKKLIDSLELDKERDCIIEAVIDTNTHINHIP